MDQRERQDPYQESILAALDGRMADTWTALPGIIQSFDPDECTAVIQPAIQIPRLMPDGSTTMLTIPLLTDCPVQFPGGGELALTFPIAAGDECLIVFAARCIDAWWQSGGVQPPAVYRMQDLSDGFCVPRVWSKPEVFPNISTTAAQLRNRDGSAYIELTSDGHITVKSAFPVNFITPEVIDSADHTVNGNLFVGGSSIFAGPLSTMDRADFADIVDVGQILTVPLIQTDGVIIGSAGNIGTLTVDELTVNNKTTLGGEFNLTMGAGKTAGISGDLHVTGASNLDGLVTSINDVVADTVSLVNHGHVALGDPPTKSPVTGVPHR